MVSEKMEYVIVIATMSMDAEKKIMGHPEVVDEG